MRYPTEEGRETARFGIGKSRMRSRDTKGVLSVTDRCGSSKIQAKSEDRRKGFAPVLNLDPLPRSASAALRSGLSRLLQPSFLHERLAKDVLFLREDFFQFAARGELIVDDVFVVGDAEFVAGAQRSAERALAVDLHPVGTVEVTNVPHAVTQGEFAVCAGDVLELQADIAGLTPADCHHIVDE